MDSNNLTQWEVDLDECTASHPDGWVFKFYLTSDGEYGCCEFGCIASPRNVIIGHFPGSQQLAYEAAEAYFHALSKETGQRP